MKRNKPIRFLADQKNMKWLKLKVYLNIMKKQAQLRAEADRLGCLSSTDVWTWDNQPHGDSIQS